MSHPLHERNFQNFLKGHAQVQNHKKIGDYILAYQYDHMM